MKWEILWIAVFTTMGILGCHSNTASNSNNPDSTFGDFDPVAAAIGFGSGANPFAPGQKFDIGIAYQRIWNENQDMNERTVEVMAFAINGYSAQVTSATIGGDSLGVLQSATTWKYGRAREDTTDFNKSDSVTFYYQNFDGESFTSKAAIAPWFGTITSPDTISAALGCTVRYSHSVSGGSITVGVAPGWSQPDTGGFTILPNQLTFLPDDSIHHNSHSFVLDRAKWDTVISPKGKHIGIYSHQEIDGLKFIVKP